MGILIGMIFWLIGIGLLTLKFISLFKSNYSQYMDRYAASAEKHMQATDYFMDAESLMKASRVSGICGLVLGVLLGLGSSPVTLLVLAAALGFAFFQGPRLVLIFMARRRLEQFEAQLPDGIDLLSKSMKSGLAAAAAFELGSRELPEPMSQEFRIVVQDTKFNRSLAEAVERLAARMPMEDTRLLAIIVSLGMREGGNMAEALDALAGTVRNRFNVRRKVKTATASTRAEVAIIASVPFLILGVFSFMNPEMMQVMWSERAGWAMLGVVVFLEIIGVSILWKIAKSVEY